MEVNTQKGSRTHCGRGAGGRGGRITLVDNNPLHRVKGEYCSQERESHLGRAETRMSLDEGQCPIRDCKLRSSRGQGDHKWGVMGEDSSKWRASSLRPQIANSQPISRWPSRYECPHSPICQFFLTRRWKSNFDITPLFLNTKLCFVLMLCGSNRTHPGARSGP